MNKILIIEDDYKWAYLLGAIMRPVAIRVDVAGSMAEANSRLQSRTYDLVLLDLRLPDSQPEETILQINPMRARAKKIILITAYPPDAYELGDAIIDGCVSKCDFEIASKLHACARL